MASNVLIYLSFHEPHRLRLPAQTLPTAASVHALREYCFDQTATDNFYHSWLDQVCKPYVELLQGSIEKDVRFLVGVSGPLLQKLGQDRGAIAGDFIHLLRDPRITPVCTDLRNSIALYLDIDLFREEMEKGRQLMFALTGRKPELAVAPLKAINTEIYHVLGRLGFRGVIVDGCQDLLHGRWTGAVYRSGVGPLLIAGDCALSHELGLALGASHNSYLPMGVSSPADKVSEISDNLVLVGYSVGSATGPVSCPRLGQWLDELQQRGVEFPDVGQILGGDARSVPNIQLPAIPSVSWEYGNVRYFLGHPSQQSVFCLMRQAFWAARLSRDEAAVDLAIEVAQWDVLELLHRCTISNGNGQQPHYLAPGVVERIGAYGLPYQVPSMVIDYYQNLVRGFTASYL